MHLKWDGHHNWWCPILDMKIMTLWNHTLHWLTRPGRRWWKQTSDDMTNMSWKGNGSKAVSLFSVLIGRITIFAPNLIAHEPYHHIVWIVSHVFGVWHLELEDAWKEVAELVEGWQKHAWYWLLQVQPKKDKVCQYNPSSLWVCLSFLHGVVFNLADNQGTSSFDQTLYGWNNGSSYCLLVCALAVLQEE